MDANDGHIVWNYNGLATVNNGNSLYSGQVTVPTRPVGAEYWLQDQTRGANGVADLNTSDGSFSQAQKDLLKQGGNWTVDVTQHCDHLTNDPTDTNCDGTRKATAIHIGSIFSNTNDVWGDGLPYQHDASGVGNALQQTSRLRQSTLSLPQCNTGTIFIIPMGAMASMVKTIGC